jgi:hypothetical protein
VILRKAIHCCAALRKNISSPNDSAYFADTFVRRGCEYYASARFAMHAGQSFNLSMAGEEVEARSSRMIHELEVPAL